jgi:hypothetical protein
MQQQGQRSSGHAANSSWSKPAWAEVPATQVLAQLPYYVSPPHLARHPDAEVTAVHVHLHPYGLGQALLREMELNEGFVQVHQPAAGLGTPAGPLDLAAAHSPLRPSLCGAPLRGCLRHWP